MTLEIYIYISHTRNQYLFNKNPIAFSFVIILCPYHYNIFSISILHVTTKSNSPGLFVC